MAAFVQSFTVTQSNDCATLSFQDTSNFGSNDQSYTYSTFTTKTITVYDQDNNIITPVINIVNNTPVTFSLDKDRYLHIIYQLSNNSITLTPVIQNMTLSCNVELAYGKAITSQGAFDTYVNSTAKDSNSDQRDPLFNVNKALLAASIFGLRSNPIKAQEMLDLANQYIECTPKTN